MTGMTACCIALPGKTDDSVNRGWGVYGSQTWILQFPAKWWIGGWWRVPKLTVKAKLVRRHWAQKHINRPLGQWQHVIFCDESRFMLFRIDNRIRVRRLVWEAMNEDCTHGNVAHGGGSVHVWGGISHMGKTSLCLLDQMPLEPFIAEFWRNTWFHMAGHGIATIGYWLMIMPDPIRLVQWMPTSMKKTSSAWIGPPIVRIWTVRTYLGRNRSWFGGIGHSVSESTATDPSSKSPDLG